MAKELLEKAMIPVSVDSTSKRKLTKEMAKTCETEQFIHPSDGTSRKMSTLAVISKELGSLLAIDKENMIITLTDLYDCHDTWKYDTSDKGHDFLYNVCPTVFAGTTPRFITNNLPPEAFAEGFASRAIWLSEFPAYKSVPWPPPLDKLKLRTLVHDLHTISKLVGEFQITPVAKTIFDLWYAKIPERKKFLKDERLYGNLNRLHLQVLKVAMVLRVAESNKLIVDENEMGRAIDLVEELFAVASRAFGGGGYGSLGPMIETIRNQVAILGETTFRELLSMNYPSFTHPKTDLEEILEILEIMGKIKRVVEARGSLDQVIRKVKREEI